MHTYFTIKNYWFYSSCTILFSFQCYVDIVQHYNILKINVDARLNLTLSTENGISSFPTPHTLSHSYTFNVYSHVQVRYNCCPKKKKKIKKDSTKVVTCCETFQIETVKMCSHPVSIVNIIIHIKM